jgi:hypothetical protein
MTICFFTRVQGVVKIEANLGLDPKQSVAKPRLA